MTLAGLILMRRIKAILIMLALATGHYADRIGRYVAKFRRSVIPRKVCLRSGHYHSGFVSVRIRNRGIGAQGPPKRGTELAWDERVKEAPSIRSDIVASGYLAAFGKPQTSTMRLDTLSACATASQSSTLTGRPFNCFPSLVSG